MVSSVNSKIEQQNASITTKRYNAEKSINGVRIQQSIKNALLNGLYQRIIIFSVLNYKLCKKKKIHALRKTEYSTCDQLRLMKINKRRSYFQ